MFYAERRGNNNFYSQLATMRNMKFEEVEMDIHRKFFNVPNKDSYKLARDPEVWKPYFCNEDLIEELLDEGPISLVTYYTGHDRVLSGKIYPFFRACNGYLYEEGKVYQYALEKGYKIEKSQLPWVFYISK